VVGNCNSCLEGREESKSRSFRCQGGFIHHLVMMKSWKSGKDLRREFLMTRDGTRLRRFDLGLRSWMMLGN
jgi:hypothetical protein